MWKNKEDIEEKIINNNLPSIASNGLTALRDKLTWSDTYKKLIIGKSGSCSVNRGKRPAIAAPLVARGGFSASAFLVQTRSARRHAQFSLTPPKRNAKK